MKVFHIIFALSIVSLPVFSQISQSERQALEDLHRFTNGASWTNTWDLSTAVTSWYGVKIDQGHVTGLNLKENNLRGELPSSLKELVYLDTLILSSNSLSGELPEIKSLKKLQVLEVNNNKLTGIWPEALMNLKNLKSLKRIGNDFDKPQNLQKIISGNENLSAVEFLTSNSK